MRSKSLKSNQFLNVHNRKPLFQQYFDNVSIGRVQFVLFSVEWGFQFSLFQISLYLSTRLVKMILIKPLHHPSLKTLLRLDKILVCFIAEGNLNL